MRVGVDLHRHAGFRGGIEHSLHIQIRAFPFLDQASCRMTDDVHVRVADGVDDTLGDPLPRLPQAGVQRGDHQIEARQKLVGVIQRAIGFDLHLAGVQDENAIPKLLLNLFDLFGLFLVPLHAQAACHAQADRMIGNGNDLHAAFRGSPRHLQHGELPVAPGGVHLQVCLHILFLDQPGELVRFCGLDLAAVFAYFGRHPWKPKDLVDFLFCGAEDLASIHDVLKGMIGQR